MNKIILKVTIILLFCIIVINIITNSSYAKYYIFESLEAIDIIIENKEYEENNIVV